MSDVPSLNDLIDQYTRSPSWDEAQELLDLHPELLSDASITIIDSLIQAACSQNQPYSVEFYEENLAFLNHRRNGIADPAAESAPGDEEVETELQDLLKQAKSAGEDIDSTESIEAATSAWEAVLNHPHLSTSPTHFKEEVFFAAGVFLYRCYVKVRNPVYVERAVEAWQQALTFSPVKSPRRSRLLSNAGLVLYDLFDQTDDQEHLLKAIAFHSQAMVHYLAPDLTLLPESFSKLGICLRARFRITQDPDDLRRMLDAFQQAVDKTPADSPKLGDRIDDLARAFRIRYSLTKNVSDMETALEFYRQALQVGGLDPYVLCQNIEGQARCLFLLYEEHNEISYLNRAIDLYRESTIDGVEPEVESEFLRNLALYLQERYELTRQVGDLKSIVSLLKTALELQPSEAARRELYDFLGNVLHTLHTQHREPRSLNDAVEAWQTAIRLTHTPSTDLARLLESLLSALAYRYRLAGNEEDLKLLSEYKESFFNLSPELKEGTLQHLVGSFIKSATPDLARDVISRHPAILDPVADQIIGSIVESPQSHGKVVVVQTLTDLRNLLSHAREHEEPENYEIGKYTTADEVLQLVHEVVEAMPPDERKVVQEALGDEEAVADLKNWVQEHIGSTFSILDLFRALLAAKLAPSVSQEEFQRAEEARKRYYFSHDQGALAEAVETWEKILALPEFPNLRKSFRLDVFNCAGPDFFEFFQDTQQKEHLDKSIALAQQAVDLTPPGNVNRLNVLNTFGVVLRARYEFSNDLDDLRSAIHTYDEAINLNPDRSLHGVLLANVGRALIGLYEATRDLATIERAVVALQQSVELCDEDDLQGLSLRLIKLAMASRGLYEASGDLNSLDRAIECHERVQQFVPREHWADFPVIRPTCLDLIARYEQSGDIQDLKRVVEICEHMVSLPDIEAQERVEFLGLLGTAYDYLSDHSSDPVLVERASAAFQEAMEDAQSGAPELNNFANALRRRYDDSGDRSELDRSIEISQRAVELEPRHTPKGALYLSNLAISIMARYDLEGSFSDLEFCINAWENAAEIIPPTSNKGVGVLLNLASSLRTRYHLTSDLTDLTRMVAMYRRALEATPPAAPDRNVFLSNLANALRDYYTRTGDLSYLDEAVEYHRQSVPPEEVDVSDRSNPLLNLTTGLLERFDIVGDLSDLEEVIGLCEHLLERWPKNVRVTGAALSNLSSALLKRYLRERDAADLDRAILATRQAIETFPENSPRGRLIVQNLGIALLDRYEISKAPEDLADAQQAIEQALRTVPSGHVYWLGMMTNLGMVMEERYSITHDERDLERAVDCFRQVCEKGIGRDYQVVINSCEHWLKLAFKRAAWEEVIEIYGYGSQAIEYLFKTQLIRAGREVWLQRLGLLPSSAAYAFAKLGKPQEAVLALEAGRARLLADSLERARADLKMLPDRGYAELYERYTAAASRLAELERVHPSPDSSMFDKATLADLRAARQQLEEAIAEIQQIPEYKHFFRVQTWAQIQRSLTISVADPFVPAAGVYLSVTSAGGLGLIVHPEGVETIWLPLDEKSLNELLVEPDSGYLISQFDVSWFKESLEKLLRVIGEMVMGPLAQALRRLWPDAANKTEKPGVTIIPGGLFALLPLHAARYQIDGVAETFLDKFDVSFTPSAKVLAETRPTMNSQEHSLFAVANPLPLPDDYEALPYSRAEVKEISRFFAGPSEILFEADATRELVQRKLGSTTYMHFACHGFFDVMKPLTSGLVLSGGELLMLSDLIRERDLSQTRLTVLSACETAMTDYGPLREEAVGLASGFLHAGVPGVIGSLWSVNDLSTTLLMFKFYEFHLGSGDGQKPLPLAKALRLAQLWLRSATNDELVKMILRFEKSAPDAAEPADASVRGRFREQARRNKTEQPFAHPFYWAAFILYGV